MRLQIPFTALALSHAQQIAALPQRSYNNGNSSDGFAADDYVKVDGLRMHSNDGPFYSTGINYWACMNLAADDSVGGNHSRFTTELDQMAAVGINHLRIMAASEGNPTPQPFRMRPALQESPGQYNEAVFVGLDRCLAEMSKRGMRATMTLNNQWQWSGGFAQYVSWANDNEVIEYPSSWNLSKPPQRPEPNTGWGNYTDEDDPLYTDYTSWINYSNMIYNTSQAETWYKDHIRTVINRRNTVTGTLYKNDPTVLSWQLANEPQPANPSDYLGAYGLTYPANPFDPLLPWIQRIASYIKSLAPNHLVSVGLESKQGEWYFKAVHSIEHVDYCTAHCWVQNWGLYDMYDASLSNLEAAGAFGREFVANTSRWAEEVGKPIVLEEFGMARDNWENEDEEYPYLSSASTHNKDAYFATLINAVIQSFQSNGSYFGTAPWAYGGVYRPETQHINGFGMVWAGDPPHESPGWYDVYDTDYVMEIIRRQSEEIRMGLQGGKGNVIGI